MPKYGTISSSLTLCTCRHRLPGEEAGPSSGARAPSGVEDRHGMAGLLEAAGEQVGSKERAELWLALGALGKMK